MQQEPQQKTVCRARGSPYLLISLQGTRRGEEEAVFPKPKDARSKSKKPNAKMREQRCGVRGLRTADRIR